MNNEEIIVGTLLGIVIAILAFVTILGFRLLIC